jgi:hypothetical protein
MRTTAHHACYIWVKGLESRLCHGVRLRVTLAQSKTDLCVMRTHGHGLGDLFVDNDVHLYALLGLFKEETIQAPFREQGRRAAQI